MNPLSAFATGLGALASTGKKSSYSDPSSEQDPGQDQFARMLNPANTPNQTPPQAPERVPARQAAPKPPADKQRSDDDDNEDAPGDATARPRAQDGDGTSAQSAKQSAKEPAAKDTSAATDTAKAKPAGADGKEEPTDATATPDAAWPPAGLGGFGMSLLAAAVPGGDALAAAAAALAASMSAATTATTATPTLPTDAAAPATTATAASALPSLGALAPAAATAQPAAATALSGEPQAAALMSLATAALDSPADDLKTDAPDAPAFVLPTTTASALNRLQDAPAVFSASPTPTPEMGSDTFDDAIGARLSWLADQKIGHAHIKVTPNEMGPVEVRLHLEGDKVNASFTAANADVRQALEQSLPRLRDMLGQQGFQLGQADVSQQQQHPSGNRNGAGTDGNGLSLEDSPPVGIPSVVLRQRGLLDAYA
ncbi:flagellar hook-length control protein FliK [Xanthomonas campestris pv. campestris]|uniref:flagellar hook-length control protein FliK n=3 Tax=Xanthomonas campestris TaxID=339 RepID=UPI000676E57F|nr:flagellar hook-length control protein FliK [Xanthomonas campestris]AKS20401.1 flagellar protein [Xanthomonas campestris pv. campestris]ALE68689.1 flagellar protein [Xanthomonas campestris pv. campestris]MCD0276194.1 flagellar hook-length control protein FliK [Xanthomonas campestris pv. campestris]MCF8794761.1 flagellar hook-length control protein FliK [Xanthomonas campestris pv. campestris]MCF8799624.1 flagellar hook-length control protein FliK [Xanthomonas campestris pv. campestris]